ncbi:hypothetical protein [Streptomyces gardneri]|uniref:Uncharacterized protein n=1 Tax=Streptomyces gardneri TaxID=66892 RepID=A0A4Y3RL37_9ACTN|nr:hypothetical protein SGA01_21550 [Streptomyces gardneri]GHH13826.1 hypothetical protein GCM10017674_61640 [Streptomyces gardneri]
MDHLAVANWMFSCVNASEDSDTPEAPKPVPRPGDADEDKEGGEGAAHGGRNTSAEDDEGMSPQALARFFG